MADIDLPPGFRFHPTDEEIITHYLTPKAINPSFTATPVMRDIDLNKCEPWDLPSKAKMGEKEWYFYYQKDRKYPTGTRTNRATEAGYWKATGKDKEIFKGRGVLVGMKKTLVFYKGRAPRGEKTNWVMHEYRLEGKLPLIQLPTNVKDEWVVCRAFNKSMGAKKSPIEGTGRMSSLCEDVLDCPTLPPLMDSSCFDSSSFAANSDAMLPSYMMGMEDFNPNCFSNINQCSNPTSSALYLQQTPYFTLHDQLIDASAAIRMHCKVEQYSGKSMVSASQDTGLSIEKNIEISSKNIDGGDDLDDPNSVGQVLDLDNMWKY